MPTTDKPAQHSSDTPRPVIPAKRPDTSPSMTDGYIPRRALESAETLVQVAAASLLYCLAHGGKTPPVPPAAWKNVLGLGTKARKVVVADLVRLKIVEEVIGAPGKADGYRLINPSLGRKASVTLAGLAAGGQAARVTPDLSVAAGAGVWTLLTAACRPIPAAEWVNTLGGLEAELIEMANSDPGDAGEVTGMYAWANWSGPKALREQTAIGKVATQTFERALAAFQTASLLRQTRREHADGREASPLRSVSWVGDREAAHRAGVAWAASRDDDALTSAEALAPPSCRYPTTLPADRDPYFRRPPPPPCGNPPAPSWETPLERPLNGPRNGPRERLTSPLRAAARSDAEKEPVVIDQTQDRGSGEEKSRNERLIETLTLIAEAGCGCEVEPARARELGYVAAKIWLETADEAAAATVRRLGWDVAAAVEVEMMLLHGGVDYAAEEFSLWLQGNYDRAEAGLSPEPPSAISGANHPVELRGAVRDVGPPEAAAAFLGAAYVAAENLA